MIQRLNSKVDADTTIYLLSIENGAVEGVLRIDPDGYIMSIFVIEEARGKGMGTQLVQMACSVLHESGRKTVGLSVHKDNEAARRLYERLGFLPYMPGHDDYTQFIKVL
jgi:ribosomal protein S18 acetylase RimI-like enzyme